MVIILSELTQKRLKELLHYDSDTGIFRWLKKRGGKDIGSIAGNINQRGYVIIGIDRKRYLGHRVAWLYITGCWPKYNIDHIDRNTANNNFANLRDVNQKVNAGNSSIRINNTSGVTGVQWCKYYAKWRGCIMLNGKSKHLGYFIEKKDAINARRKAERKYGFINE